MSVQSEITRIKSARDNSFTQVAAKGVTVPNGADIEDLPGLIQAIQQGGGGIELPETITAGDTPIMFIQDAPSVTSTSFTATGLKLTVPRAGTYRFTSRAVRYNTSGTTNQGAFYKNGTAVSGTTVSFASGKNTAEMQADIQCAAGDTVEVYLKARSSSYPTAAYYLVACIDWDNGFGGGSGGGNTFTFNIGSTTYVAETGMTWGQWVESSYNTDGEFEYRERTQSMVDDSGIYKANSPDRDYYITLNSSRVKATAVIIEGQTYTLYG